MIYFVENPSNGDLMVTLAKEYDFADFLCESLDHTPSSFLAWCMDDQSYIGNDWYTGVTIGLTEADTIAQGLMTTDDDVDPENWRYENVWYYPDYQIKHWYEELLDSGVVMFKRVPQKPPFVTNLDREINDMEDVITYVHELHSNGEAYHFDESADSIVWSKDVTKEQERKIDALNEAMYRVSKELPLAYLCFLERKDGNLPSLEE